MEIGVQPAPTPARLEPNPINQQEPVDLPIIPPPDDAPFLTAATPPQDVPMGENSGDESDESIELLPVIAKEGIITKMGKSRFFGKNRIFYTKTNLFAKYSAKIIRKMKFIGKC